MTRRIRTALGLGVVLVALGPLARAHAQEAAADPTARALELHEQGAQALRDARFARARDLFREALELSPNAGSAYNLALALRGTGESSEAIQIFERLLSGELGEVGETRANDMRRWIVEERGALSTLVLSIEGADAAQLSLDGREVGTVTRDDPLRLEVDAGRRTILARADGFELAEETLFAERAAEQRVALTLRPLPRGGLLDEPAFWITVGAVVLAGVAVGVVAAYAPYEAPPESYPPFGVAHALTAADR